MRQPIDLSVYLVLDPDLCGGAQGMIDTTRAAVQNGATCVQLRAPLWKKRALVECGRALKSALAAFHVPLIINDHADVCLAVDAEGLHVGQDDLSPSDARTHHRQPKRYSDSLYPTNRNSLQSMFVWLITSESDRFSRRAPNRMRAMRLALRVSHYWPHANPVPLLLSAASKYPLLAI